MARCQRRAHTTPRWRDYVHRWERARTARRRCAHSSFRSELDGSGELAERVTRRRAVNRVTRSERRVLFSASRGITRVVVLRRVASSYNEAIN